MPTVSLNDCCNECPDGVTLRHNGVIAGQANCAGCECCGLTAAEVTALINQALGTAGGSCADQPLYVDCEGGLLPQTVDALGNPIVQVCPSIPEPKQYSASLDGGPPADCCVLQSDNGRYAINSDEGCITHACYAGSWIPMCGVGGGGPVVSYTEVCYDLGAAASGQLCFGGPNNTGWLVNGANLLDFDCGVDSSTVTAVDNTKLVTTTPNTNPNGQIPTQGSLPGLYSASTGTAITPTGSIVVSGDPAVQPYYGSPRPLMFVDFEMDAGCTGPYVIDFVNGQQSGTIGLALWDQTTDTLLGLTGGGAGNGTSISYNNTPGYGDYIILDTFADQSTTHNYQFTFGGNDALATTGDNIKLVFVSLGGDQPNPIESIDGLTITYQRAVTTGQPECCQCYTIGELAAAMNLADFTGDSAGNQVVWSVSGTRICAQVETVLVPRYGNLTSCEVTAEPNGTTVGTPPPFFSTAPTGTTQITTATDLCATCTNGTVTGYRYRLAGTTNPWTLI